MLLPISRHCVVWSRATYDDLYQGLTCMAVDGIGIARLASLQKTVECYVGERQAKAHEECRGPLEYKYAAYASWGLQDRTTQGSFEDFARDRFIIGDKGSVKEEIARYHELLGVDHFIMRCQWPGLPQKQVLSSIQRLGEIFASI